MTCSRRSTVIPFIAAEVAGLRGLGAGGWRWWPPAVTPPGGGANGRVRGGLSFRASSFGVGAGGVGIRGDGGGPRDDEHDVTEDGLVADLEEQVVVPDAAARQPSGEAAHEGQAARERDVRVRQDEAGEQLGEFLAVVLPLAGG